MVLSTAIAVAKPCIYLDQLLVLIEKWMNPHPFAVAILVHLIGFVQVLRIEADHCKGKYKLKKSKDEIQNVLQAEARASTTSDTHDEGLWNELACSLLFIMRKLQKNVAQQRRARQGGP